MQRRGDLLTATLLFSIFVGTAPAGEPAGRAPLRQIQWTGTPEQALQAAQATQRPILAFVTSDHCGYCRKMERATWAAPQIIEQVQKSFVPLRLHAGEHRELVARLKVRSFPTTLVFTPSGQVVHGAAGFLGPVKTAGLLKASLPTKVAAKERATTPGPSRGEGG